jgi:CRISPR/Cas system-associated exonuclease Cas4 (RecB family)
MEKIVDEVADRYRDELAPAIDRVWDDGIASIRADLREWLRRAAEQTDGWCPERFELSFGLSERAQADPASWREPAAVAGGLQLRGSIDLIERHPRGVLRVTDHKTGKTVADKEVVVGGGAILQPLLYALATEKILDTPVESGRLYYCTSAGGFEERTVNLDAAGRAAIENVIGIVGGALDQGFLPAMPAAGECRYCDYRPVCGPYEEQRASLKPKARLGELKRLREMP